MKINHLKCALWFSFFSLAGMQTAPGNEDNLKKMLYSHQSEQAGSTFALPNGYKLNRSDEVSHGDVYRCAVDTLVRSANVAKKRPPLDPILIRGLNNFLQAEDKPTFNSRFSPRTLTGRAVLASRLATSGSRDDVDDFQSAVKQLLAYPDWAFKVREEIHALSEREAGLVALIAECMQSEESTWWLDPNRAGAASRFGDSESYQYLDRLVDVWSQGSESPPYSFLEMSRLGPIVDYIHTIFKTPLRRCMKQCPMYEHEDNSTYWYSDFRRCRIFRTGGLTSQVIEAYNERALYGMSDASFNLTRHHDTQPVIASTVFRLVAAAASANSFEEGLADAASIVRSVDLSGDTSSIKYQQLCVRFMAEFCHKLSAVKRLWTLIANLDAALAVADYVASQEAYCFTHFAPREDVLFSVEGYCDPDSGTSSSYSCMRSDAHQEMTLPKLGTVDSLLFLERMASAFGVTLAATCTMQNPESFSSIVVKMMADEHVHGSGQSVSDVSQRVQEALLKVASTSEIPEMAPQDFNEWPGYKRLEWWANSRYSISVFKNLARIFRLIGRCGAIPFINDSGESVSLSTETNLDVLVGSQGSGHSIARQINQTQCHIGHAVLMRHLVHMKSSDDLRAMRNLGAKFKRVIRVPDRLQEKLGSNAPLGMVVQNLLTAIKEGEAKFLAFWAQEEDGYDGLYEMNLSQKFKLRLMPASLKKWLNDSEGIRSLNTVIALLEQSSVLTASSVVLPWYRSLEKLTKSGDIGWLDAWEALGTVPAALSVAENVAGGFEGLRCTVMNLVLMQEQLIALRTYLVLVGELYMVLLEADFPSELVELLNIWPSERGTPFRNFLESLDTDTFKEKSFSLTKKKAGSDSEKMKEFKNRFIPQFLSNWGRIGISYERMLEFRDKFIPSYIAVGTIDFLLGLNELKALSTDQAPYCFPEFIEGAHDPEVCAHECWSPLVKDRAALVTNDFALGGDRPRTMIITGANARGKTTAMRALAHAALLARTLGVAPARSCTMPANIHILAALNMQDDPAKQQSYFAANADYLGSIFRTLKRKPNRPYLIAIDELYKGTNIDASEDCAVPYVWHCAQMPHVLSLFSTHLKKVPLLGDKFPRLMANVRLRNYRLEQGKDDMGDEYTNIAKSIACGGAFGEGELQAAIRAGADVLLAEAEAAE